MYTTSLRVQKETTLPVDFSDFVSTRLLRDFLSYRVGAEELVASVNGNPKWVRTNVLVSDYSVYFINAPSKPTLRSKLVNPVLKLMFIVSLNALTNLASCFAFQVLCPTTFPHQFPSTSELFVNQPPHRARRAGGSFDGEIKGRR